MWGVGVGEGAGSTRVAGRERRVGAGCGLWFEAWVGWERRRERRRRGMVVRRRIFEVWGVRGGSTFGRGRGI